MIIIIIIIIIFLPTLSPPHLPDSTIISQYPSSPEYPRFYELDNLLRGMVEGSIKIHPYTREMLAALDQLVNTLAAVIG